MTANLWYWLSQNAAAVQALCAVLALLGLIGYVIDTDLIRRDQQRTNRATVTPYLTLADEDYNAPYTDRSTVTLTSKHIIRNVGAGTALKLKASCRPVPAEYELDRIPWIDDTSNELSTVIGALQLMSGEQTEVVTGGLTYGLQFLTVVEAEDQRGARHQLHILIAPDYERATLRWRTRENMRQFH